MSSIKAALVAVSKLVIEQAEALAQKGDMAAATGRMRGLVKILTSAGSPRQTEKILLLGLHREPGYVYVLADGGVARFKDGDFDGREFVRSLDLVREDGWNYLLDADGDVSRWRLLQ